jgi:hypothetical protein
MRVVGVTAITMHHYLEFPAFTGFRAENHAGQKALTLYWMNKAAAGSKWTGPNPPFSIALLNEAGFGLYPTACDVYARNAAFNRLLRISIPL